MPLVLIGGVVAGLFAYCLMHFIAAAVDLVVYLLSSAWAALMSLADREV